MKILIIDIDSKIQNYALKKIEKYHQGRGDDVTWNFPLMKYSADKIYVSCVFTKNREKCAEYETIDNAIIGGSGYDLTSKLPDEIENIKPRLNFGFTTRGCIRKCGFCIVPEKEGRIHIVGDLLDLWNGKNKEIILMDNNILAVPDHFELICKQARDNKIKLDFNQGLDHRLLTDDIAKELKSLKLKIKRFAFDHPSCLKSVEKAIDILDDNGLKYNFWYVLVGYDTTFEQDLARLNYLRDRKQRAYVQRYKSDKRYIALAQWVARHDLFAKLDFKKYLELHKNGIYKKYFPEMF
jgi:radical SAM superfamily enzyme YgiQ (UPF0313 family)